MEKVNYTEEQARKAFLTGHYDYMTQALSIAVNRVPAWRLAKDLTPCPLFEVFGFAKRWDEEHPRQEGDPGCYLVSREGAIGYAASGLEYQVRWIFIPMEPGPERDALVQKTLDEFNKAEAEMKAAEEAAKAPAPASAAPQKRFCRYCGAPIKNPGAKFCSSCGEPL